MSKYRVWLLLVLCNLFWAGNYVFGKYVVAEMPPLMITFSRWLVASVLLLIIAYFYEKPQWSLVPKEWISLLAMAVLGMIGYNTILYAALEYTSPTNASLVSALNPGIIVIFSLYMLKERISKIQSIGLVVSLLGVVVILTGGRLTQILHVSYNRGDLLMLAAVIMWTFYSIIGKRIKNIPPITTTAVTALIATIIMAPFAIVQGINYTELSPLALQGIAYMIIFPSVGSFVFWNIGVRQISASKAGVFLNLMPVFTAIISWSLGERITLAQISGGILVFIGVYLTTGMLDIKLASKRQQKGTA
ncbi:Threonine/homoserine efflux transporter RhtA [Natronincola peptidivorans]|uniref:Threonine/homoserine efflux transporter RhtA n=1 Tax=Natronincola peptidivorans TaxID=426128 RepID=A0A1I0AT28_9FIRM|nr:DMT family transporter [Natronincola peptidivorans]SES97550.1 Threonine/homoserine efflux transporter RhtA [Natronincola peptidivorans]